MTTPADIRCLVLDVDGVLTDGRLWYADGPEPWRAFHIQDGLAIRWFQRLLGDVVILTAKTSAAIQNRAAELGISEVIHGSDDKGRDFERLCRRRDLQPAQVAAMGDDLTDLPVLRACGYALAPANAVPPVQRIARYVCSRAGGHGAVRQAIEHLLQVTNRWSDVLAMYGADRDEPAARRPRPRG